MIDRATQIFTWILVLGVFAWIGWTLRGVFIPQRDACVSIECGDLKDRLVRESNIYQGLKEQLRKDETK